MASDDMDFVSPYKDVRHADLEFMVDDPVAPVTLKSFKDACLYAVAQASNHGDRVPIRVVVRSDAAARRWPWAKTMVVDVRIRMK